MPARVKINWPNRRCADGAVGLREGAILPRPELSQGGQVHPSPSMARPPQEGLIQGWQQPLLKLTCLGRGPPAHGDTLGGDMPSLPGGNCTCVALPALTLTVKGASLPGICCTDGSGAGHWLLICPHCVLCPHVTARMQGHWRFNMGEQFSCYWLSNAHWKCVDFSINGTYVTFP